ncbi:RNA 2'-phosphotransferase [Deinococcus sp. KNUC1210]|uniref:RNA 2'-phosphotransferase n=1 Tax=Deinococcus sp. KNUC1210 TaxID=2917691 RepID=UPI001EF12A91|nr:RNA 2'-phosphotransferase [Deinococcus sp. KNUC1210]ULH15644.1 RNA 2'-phosphotransferase [Deinococcus sp. KNUC1210]
MSDLTPSVTLSRRLSYLLRHAPHEAGLTLAPGGWVAVQELLHGLARQGLPVSAEQLAAVVAGSEKQRFSFDASGERIRANQGHSVPVDLELTPQTPPELLYHGTAAQAVAAILREGLQRRQRHHVHLSPDNDTARTVGARRGRPVILRVDAAAMHAAGHLFYRSENGVWLTDCVPPEFLTVLPGQGTP